MLQRGKGSHVADGQEIQAHQGVTAAETGNGTAADLIGSGNSGDGMNEVPIRYLCSYSRWHLN